MIQRSRFTLPVAVIASLATACSSSGDGGGSSSPSVAQTFQSARVGYSDLLFAQYSDVVALAADVEAAVATLVAAPSTTTLTGAREAWLTARPYYQQTEVGRFYDGPIDDADGPEGELNAWPLDENYIDYVAGDDMAGIINDPVSFPTIDEALLRSLNGVGGDANVATGWHAIEFLLWGQDTDPNGPGARPLEDYTSAPNADRRGAYLSLVSAMLVADLASVRDEWAPGTGAYRAVFLSEPSSTSIERILTGIATLGVGELRGERILVPFNSQSQEDEHSCFSDTTHLDHIFDGIGIRNVWRGEYDAFDNQYDFQGPALEDVFEVGSPTRGAALNAAIDDMVTALEAQVAPFDQAILGASTDPGRVALQAVIDALSQFNVAINEAAGVLDLTITSS